METIKWAELRDLASTPATLPPPGNYVMVCEHAEWGETRNGHPMIRARYRITEGAHTGGVLFGTQVLAQDSPVSVDYFLRFMDAHQVYAEDITDTDQAVRLMVGKSVCADVTHEEWEGRQRARTDRFRPDGKIPPAKDAYIDPF